MSSRQNFPFSQLHNAPQLSNVDPLYQGQQDSFTPIGTSNTFCNAQNRVPFATQTRLMDPQVISQHQPTFTTFLDPPTHRNQEFRANSIQEGSLYTNTSVSTSQEQSTFAEYTFNKNTTVSMMPQQDQFVNMNVDYSNLRFEAPADPLPSTLTSASESHHPDHLTPSYDAPKTVAHASQMQGKSSDATTHHYNVQPSTSPGDEPLWADIEDPIEWLSEEQEAFLLKAASHNRAVAVENRILEYPKALNQPLHPEDARGHLNVPVFDLTGINSCYCMPLGSFDKETRCFLPVSLHSCLRGQLDDPTQLVFDGWEPGYFTLYMVYHENQARPKLVRIASENNGRKMTKAHLAHLIAREYAKMHSKDELGLRGFLQAMDANYLYAGEHGRVDFRRIKVTHIDIDRRSAIGFPNIVIGYSANR